MTSAAVQSPHWCRVEDGSIGKTRGWWRGGGQEEVEGNQLAKGVGKGRRRLGTRWAARGPSLHPGRAGLSKALAHSASEQVLGLLPASRVLEAGHTALDRQTLPSRGWQHSGREGA